MSEDIYIVTLLFPQGCWPLAHEGGERRRGKQSLDCGSMMEGFPETASVRQLSFIVPGVGYIRALKVWVERVADWS